MNSPTLLALEGARVLVVGDVILDRYWYGATRRISPEAPVPIVQVQRTEERAGGAGNVALNVRSLGGQTVLIGVTGLDAAAETLRGLLQQRGVECRFVEVAGFPTVTKLRVLSQHQQLIRLDFEDDALAAPWGSVIGAYRQHIKGTNVVLLSDYAKGSLGCAVELIRLAHEAGKPVLVDPKGSDFTRYRGATVITPNWSEFITIVGPCEDEQTVEQKARGLCEQLALEALLITRGERGMTLIPQQGERRDLPAHAAEVYDVTGAGDTVIATLATGLAAGLSLPEATALANTAAGLVVAKLGTASVSMAELAAALHMHPHTASGIVDEDQLMTLVAEARGRGQRIVMTNGCFDILHAGHVYYLEAARKLGDRLIVAVNDDASVKRLKGSGRPVNPLPRRMLVLDALTAVDWVVPFPEDTPERLLARLLPDVLVKGGDYSPDRIAGASLVKTHGGEVVVIDYLEGFSTTELIDSLQRVTLSRAL
ncbi:MAG: bifunctional D-glycero-beta-D-manno-heptose-7-phosphate kinase/D-glycero-beta-D-manno-heptose 1-phosphate adenylyltransferase HldE [Gammaproteobacteria bacterium]